MHYELSNPDGKNYVVLVLGFPRRITPGIQRSKLRLILDSACCGMISLGGGILIGREPCMI